MNESLKRYCIMASMESLRGMADEFAIAGEDAGLEIVCDEIERRCVMDRNLVNAQIGNKGVENDET
jgi:hypothetical protein